MDPDDVKRHIRKAATARQRKLRANQTDEQRNAKRVYDREYRRRKRESINFREEVDIDLDPTTAFMSKRLRLSAMNCKLENELKNYGIEDKMLIFEKKLEQLKIIECTKCDTFHWSTHNTCYCTTHKAVLKSELLHIGTVPEELSNLSYVEELLISKVHPMISIYKLKGGQFAYHGNVINFRQDVASFALKLPHAVESLKGLISVCCSTPTFHKDFVIRRNIVSVALHWLKVHNKYYTDIVIDLDIIKLLPTNGHYNDLVNCDISNIEDESTPDTQNDDGNETDLDRVVVPGVNAVPTADKIKHHLKWPAISSDPINEFNTVGYIVQAFPVLFPYGKGDYLNVKNKQITARVYFQYLMNKIDRRFSSHKLFPYFALNSILRWEALSLGTLYMKKKPTLKNLNIENLKDIVSQSCTLPKSVMVYSSSIRGSKAYWMSRTYELDAMVDRFGLPTIFFSLSAADHHWPRQFEILLGDSRSPEVLTESERRNLLVEKADICSDFFYESVTIFIVEVLVPFLKVFEYWFRFEWQMRGVAHVHGVLWLSDAPSVTNFDQMTETEKENVIKYFSSLIHAWNPETNYVVTVNHPCRIKLSQVDDRKQDLAALINTVQKHKCSLRCLKKSYSKGPKKEVVVKCRHHFPHKLQENSTIEKNDRGHLEFFPSRNDPFINKLMDLMLALWRANHDPTGILSYSGFTRYISKYASKGEVKSEDLLKILKMIVFNSNAEQSVKTVIQKLFLSLAADRDYSFQEVIHLLKGHKLYQSSRTFVVLNLSENEWEAKADLSVLSDKNEVEKDNLDTLSLYASRPSKYGTFTLLRSMKFYDIKSFHKYNKERVVRIIPRFKEQTSKTVSENVWRQNAMLNIPWRDYSLLKTHDTWEETCTSQGITLEMFPYHVTVKEYVDSEDEEELSFDVKDDYHCFNADDWMLICNLSGTNTTLETPELGFRDIDISYPWTDNVCDLNLSHVISNFIDDSKKIGTVSRGNVHLPKCNDDQQNVINILQRQIESISSRSTKNIPKICVCEGFAGTGKSVVLETMVKKVNDQLGEGSAWVMAPTGSSALHVNGQTIHSAVRLNWHNLTSVPDLKGETLFKWREKHENVKFIFIEEYSMVGARLIYVLHKRLCQLTESHESFGGLFIWFYGNIRQLPPVGDTPWFKEDVSNCPASVVAASLLHKEISIVCFLTSQVRQENHLFLKCLENISVGILDDCDKQLLKCRIHTEEEIELMESFVDSVHIFSKKKDVDFYNLKRLVLIGKPVIRINSENSSRHAKAASTDQAMGLPQYIFLSIGCRVMLKRNLWVDGGLVNGSLGTILEIVYQSSDDQTPFALIVKFDTYYGPVLENGGVPIVRCTNSWYNNNMLCSRHMFPLQLAYAVTIYKSEGLTLPKVVFHVIAKEMAAGEFYVALSRVRRLIDIVISYDGVLEDCPLFHINPDIYKEKISAESKLRLKELRGV